MSPLRLRAEAVEKRYGRVQALAGVDFEIGPGEAVAILGANGAGKSSLLRILAGLSRPSAGRFVAETDAGDVLSRDQARGRIGYVGHATLLYGELTARENLRFAARLQGQAADRETLDRCLAQFDLQDVADRRADTFSRGLAQRLSIARALVHEPSVLLLDEPFTGLDELSSERLTERLAGLQAAGTETARSLVVITHDPRRAVALADQTLLLHRGRVRERTRRADPAFDVESLRTRLADLARTGEPGALA